MSDTSKPARFAAALSTLPNWERAVDDVLTTLFPQISAPPDLMLIFVSSHHADALERISTLLGQHLGVEKILGCTAESVVGGEWEIERNPALAVWTAVLPGVQITPLTLRLLRTPEGGVIDGWPDDCLDEWPADSALIVLGDPFTFPADLLLERMNEDRPGVRVVGGMASAGSQPGENRLLSGTSVRSDGAVAMLMRGPVGLRTVVSQGCRPVGRPMVVTRAEQNILHELGGRPALEQLTVMYQQLPTRDQRLARTGLQVGRVVSEYRETFEPGDFLIRNVVGVDPRYGIVAVGDYIRTGQTIQFHVRDHESADDDLRQMLNQVASDSRCHVAGALLFTCNGRGTNLFPQPHHDAQCIRKALGDVPMAGLFAAGELGPVGSQNFVHGFTASIALFVDEDPPTG